MGSKKNGHGDNGFARLMADSAHQIWLTGLSVVAQVDEHGTRSLGGLTKMPAHATRIAAGLFGGVRDKLQLRTKRLLNALQIPTARDVQELSARVDELNRTVQSLSAAAEKNRGRKTATRKKTVARKKPAGGTARGKQSATGKSSRGNGSSAALRSGR